MRRTKLSEIKISDAFASTIPSEEKMCECRYNWNTYHRQDRYIVVNQDGYLIDGYVQYLVLKENNIDEAEIKISHCRKKRWYRKNTEDWNIPHYRSEETTYIYGKHYNERKGEYSKEYVWRVPKSWSELGWENGLECGDRIFADTNYGIKEIVVTKIEKTDICPVCIPVRRVVKRVNN